MLVLTAYPVRMDPGQHPNSGLYRPNRLRGSGDAFSIRDIHTVVFRGGSRLDWDLEDLYTQYCPPSIQNTKPLLNITGNDMNFNRWWAMEVVRKRAFGDHEQLVYYSWRTDLLTLVTNARSFNLAVSDALHFKQRILAFFIRREGSSDGKEQLQHRLLRPLRQPPVSDEGQVKLHISHLLC